MHRRYQAQWDVIEFREFICWFVEKEGDDQLFLTWDDHDFAWNNSHGFGTEKGTVPADVKQISRRLFEQFRAVLRAGKNEPYPAFSSYHALSQPLQVVSGEEVGVEEFPEKMIDKVRFAITDGRWYSHPRDDTASAKPLLGPTQWAKLERLLDKRPALTVIASGLPLMHNYVGQNQSWGPDRAGASQYPEFEGLLHAARSPVLFLAGDIHRNEWGGLIGPPGGPPSKHVLQVCSSPAAIGNFLWFKFQPAYGIADVSFDAHPSGVAKITLNELRKSHWRSSEKNFRFAPTTGWTPEAVVAAPIFAATLQQEAENAPPSETDLTVFSVRALDAGALSKKQGDQSVFDRQTPLALGLEDADDFYDDNTIKAEPGSGPGAACPHAITVSFQSRQFKVGRTPERITDAWTACLDRAAAKQPALFIHGFNNSFVKSVDMAHQLRVLYGQSIEPALFSWPSDNVAMPLLDGGSDAKDAIDNAAKLGAALWATAHPLGQALGDGRKVTLVVRSMGALVLHAYIDLVVRKKGAADTLLKHVNRVVMSCPAIFLDQLEQLESALSALNIPIWVILNSDDRVIKLFEKGTGGHAHWSSHARKPTQNT